MCVCVYVCVCILCLHQRAATAATAAQSGAAQSGVAAGKAAAAQATLAALTKEVDEAVHIMKLKFSPDGTSVAVSFQNGVLKLYGLHNEPTGFVLEEYVSFKHSNTPIIEVCWSPDGQYIATADSDRCVALFRYYHRDEDVSKPMQWMYIGRNRAHAKRITNLYFGTLMASHDPHYQYVQRQVRHAVSTHPCMGSQYTRFFVWLVESLFFCYGLELLYLVCVDSPCACVCVCVAL